MDDELPMMTLDPFIAHLQAIRGEHGGDALVVMCDYEPVAPPVFRFRESILGNETPEPYVFLTDRRQEDDEADQGERPPQKG
jgi:hypothetical protein